MFGVALIPILLIIFALIIGIAVFGMKQKIPGKKFMALGISIILFGGIIAIDPDSNLAGIEYLISFIGLVLTFVGFIKND